MIATLTGTVAEKIGDTVVLDVNGVGYGLLTAVNDFSESNLGDETKFYIYEHIRENSHDLFGFIDLQTKGLFEQLLGVNGVGPKMAINILSIGTVGQVLTAIAEGDVKFLQSASGVGKRVAERLVVDLKDKVGLSHDAADALLTRPGINQHDDAIQALMALGYSSEDALNSLETVSKELPTEERVRLALKGNSH